MIHHDRVATTDTVIHPRDLTALSCNPYNSQLALTCTVEGLNTPTFSIIWFKGRNNRDEEFQDSQQRVDIDVVESPDQGGTAQFTRCGSRLSLSQLDEVNDVGQYWCQVRLGNGTLFQEKSNILTLGSEEQYLGLSHCGFSGGQVDQLDCLQIQLILGPSGTNQDTSTAIVSVIQSLILSADFSPTPTTGGPAFDQKNSSKNLSAIYILIAIIVVFSMVIILLLIALAILRHSTLSKAPEVWTVVSPNNSK